MEIKDATDLGHEFLANMKKTLEARETDAMWELYREDTPMTLFGTAKNGIIRSYQELVESNIVNNTVAVDEMTLSNFELYQSFRYGKIMWMACSYDYSYVINNISYSFHMRVTIVQEEIDGKWIIRQYHNSFPQFGEDTLWPSIDGIQKDIQEIISKYQLSSDLLESDPRKKIFEYLKQAQLVLDSK